MPTGPVQLGKYATYLPEDVRTHPDLVRVLKSGNAARRSGRKRISSRGNLLKGKGSTLV